MDKHPFGEEYADAHLSKVEQSEEVMNILLPWVQRPSYILYFSGNVGNGKTYFASAWYNHIMISKKPIRVFKEPDFFNHLQEIVSKGWNPHTELSKLCECPYIILDDMGISKNSEWRQEMLESFIDYRLNANTATLITSNLISSTISTNYHPRLTSRLYSAKNKIIELNEPDRRQMEYK